MPTLYTLDLESGEMTIVADFPDLVAATGNIGFEFDDAEVPHAILGDDLYRLDPATSTSTHVGSTGYDGHANLALGPDGGLLPYEVDKLGEAGFEAITMGPHALRTETALAALWGQLDLLRRRSSLEQR